MKSIQVRERLPGSVAYERTCGGGREVVGGVISNTPLHHYTNNIGINSAMHFVHDDVVAGEQDYGNAKMAAQRGIHHGLAGVLAIQLDVKVTGGRKSMSPHSARRIDGSVVADEHRGIKTAFHSFHH